MHYYTSAARNIALAALSVIPATGAVAQNLSFYGSPGVIDMPSAEMLDDGSMALTSSLFGPTLRNTLTFQITPKLQGSFRYGVIEDFYGADGALYDRSFDLHYQLVDEGKFVPALAVGLRDFGGTGIYSSEYIVATKAVTPAFKVTGGLGWGRLGERDGFSSPFTSISEDFGIRPDTGEGGISTTGQLDFGAWFKGDVALFGGVEWKATEKLTLLAEYSSDTYSRETNLGIIAQESPYNVGLKYQFNNGVDLGVYYLYGTDVGVQLSYIIDNKNEPFPSGGEESPDALVPRNDVAAASWNKPNPKRSLEDTMRLLLGDQGLLLEGLSVQGDRAKLRIINTRFPSEAQALGRAARALANALPANVETFEITFVAGNLPTTTATLRRSDLEALEFAYDGAAESRKLTALSDAASVGREGELAGLYPKFTYGLTPYLTPSFFDPDQPVRVEVGAALSASYTPQPGLVFSGQLRQPFIDSVSSATRVSDSVLPHVRTDAVLYAQESDLSLAYLTAEYFFRPASNVYGRVTAGYLEQMFGGVSAELLWRPVDSRLALGAEVNYVGQRAFDTGFDFQDYRIATGHASAYYAFGNGFHGQLDVGRYLAGDWGATVTLDREFKNGVSVGAFFTLTDVSFEEFGEGSFDKGIVVEIPLNILTGKPSQTNLAQVIRPVQRDGGARLSVRNRLYDATRDYSAIGFDDQWSKFWR